MFAFKVRKRDEMQISKHRRAADCGGIVVERGEGWITSYWKT